MKIQPAFPRFVPRVAVLLAMVAGMRLVAAPLAAPASAHVQPDAASPVLVVLPAGTEPFPASGAAAPAGWQAVVLPGAHEVFVRNGDMLKDYTPRPGASYLWRLAGAGAKPGPLVEVATAERGDLAVVLAPPQGGYTKFKLSKPLIAYIATPAVSPAERPAPVLAAVAPPPVVTSIAPPVAGPIPPPAPVRTPVPSVAGESPRLFQGTLTSTRSLLHPRRPYDYQLNDVNGRPYAFLDVSRLSAAVQPDADLGRTVVVYGVAKSVPDEALMVIEGENLETK